jgi:predicted dehydrogenase
MVGYVLVGAGARGKDAYGRWIARNAAKARLLAVAEPREARREQCSAQHRIPASLQFTDWRQLFARGKLAEACIVATQDHDHVEPALAAMAAGYHVLLEKPMALSEADCRTLVAASETAGVMLRICHVLRSTGFFTAVKGAVDSGMLGQVATIRHSENVSYWHYAHSYVRGNWRNTAEASPMILAKSCHDLDILCWIAGARPRAVQSFGSQEYFRKDRAPSGAPERCTDGCPHQEGCPWYAPRLYIHGTPVLKNVGLSRGSFLGLLARFFGTEPLDRLWDWKEWPASTISDDLSRAARLQALRTGPYGRCVYRCDNDVVDRQVVSLQFDNGIAATFTLHGHSYHEGRQIRIDGSAGSLEGEFGLAGEELVYFNHRRGGRKLLWRSRNPFKGHGGGDERLMEDFNTQVAALAGGAATGAPGASMESAKGSARAALQSHLVCFAAERSRREGRVIVMEEEGADR